MEFQVVRRDPDRCVECDYCHTSIACPGEAQCTGCGSCVAACPGAALELVMVEEERPLVSITVNGQPVTVPSRLTLLRALELCGVKVGVFPGEGEVIAPCRTGGCHACAVLVDGELRPSCITPVQPGQVVETASGKRTAGPPQRLVFGFSGHMVGGVGTPWEAKASGWGGYIEVACFAAGCILRCPTCQNWETTFRSRGEPLTPDRAATLLTLARKRYGVDRLAISGGEATLNRPWLLDFLRSLKEKNPDSAARLHVDTNSVYLTPDYLEELVAAGMTDIGADIKGLGLETFQRITGRSETALASRLYRQGWEAIEYLLTTLYPRLFVGLGLPYNSALISTAEIAAIGARLARWQPEVQVVVLDYRPEFRRLNLERPRPTEMIKVKRLLENRGLKRVICQTTQGMVGPG